MSPDRARTPLRTHGECDQCAWSWAYAVVSVNGEMRLCMGCYADLRAVDKSARLVERSVAA